MREMNHGSYIEPQPDSGAVEFHEHIYENVAIRYKQKLFDGLINGFGRRGAPMNAQHEYECDFDLSDDRVQMCDDDENSYTSCAEDSFYENLEFLDCEIYQNDALSDWMRHLVYETADYEMDNIMFVKSIPSVFNVQSRAARRSLSRSEITMNFLKILWNREDNEVDAITLLLQAFSSMLRDHSRECFPYSSTIASAEVKKAPAKKHRQSSSTQKTIDKRSYQKLERVILSVSLNSVAITYNRSHKFYFALVCSEAFLKIPSTVQVRHLVRAIDNAFALVFASESERVAFYRELRPLLRGKFREIRAAAAAVTHESGESIYQQIWTCQTIASDDSGALCPKNAQVDIYASLEQVRASDDNQWEIDDEFSFMTTVTGAYCSKMNNRQQNSDDDEYKTVWVLYSDESPELNKICYDLSQMSSLNAHPPQHGYEERTVRPESPSVGAISHDIPAKYFAPVEAWKVLLKSPFYMEDEEDIIVNDSVASTNFPSVYDTENESIKSVNASSNSLPLLDDTSSIKSSHGSYKSVSEDALDMQEKTESPKRERFRDKFRLKFGSKAASVDISSPADSPSSRRGEDDSERHIVFGCSLEKVEKDADLKDIPKLIVECVKMLEMEQNAKISGIYRISGNKITIDSIRKKMNEKHKSQRKESKREPKYACLAEQDVHTLTGLVKMFFRDLKSPLMSRSVFSQCTSDRLPNANKTREALKQMPSVNYETLRHMFRHFKKIEKYQDENLMNSGNLAICLGLCLFSSNVESPNPFDDNISKCNMLCKYLIDHYCEVFESNL